MCGVCETTYVFCFCSSPLEWDDGFFSVHLYFCVFLLSVYGAVAPRFSAIVKSDIFILCRDSLSIAACVKFCKVVLLTVL